MNKMCVSQNQCNMIDETEGKHQACLALSLGVEKINAKSLRVIIGKLRHCVMLSFRGGAHILGQV